MTGVKKYFTTGAFLLVLGVACPGSAAQDPISGSVDELLRSISLAKPAMSSAPDFNLLDANGSPVALSGYRGRWVLLNFWATWCGPCREEMPSMERLSREFTGQGLAVLAVNQRESAALVRQFLQAHRLSFTSALDTTGRVAGYYRVYGIPVSYLIDANGRAIGAKAGPMDWSSTIVFEAFRRLLGGGAASSIHLEPAKPMAAALRATGEGVAIRRHHDQLAEPIGYIGRGDILTPLGVVSGAGGSWYMAKTKNGEVGWVRAGDVEETKPSN